MVFVFRYIPLKSSLCPFVLKPRARRITHGHGVSALPVGAPHPPRLAPPRHRRGARHGIVRNIRHYPRALPTRITLRRDGDIAPYRHYARKIRTRGAHAHYPGGASRPTAMPHTWCAAPLSTRDAHRQYPRRITYDHGARALPVAARNPGRRAGRQQPPVGVPHPPGSRPTAIAHAWCLWRNIRKKRARAERELFLQRDCENR